jgi:hypothetical protein
MPLSADSLPGDHDGNNNFIDSIGVNTHMVAPTVTSPYTNYASLKTELVKLGVRHIRDTFTTQNQYNFENNLADLANSGIHSELCLTESEDANNYATVNVSAAAAVAYLQAGHFANSIEVVEGINEPDQSHGVTGLAPTNWLSLTQSQQQSLYTGVQGLKAPAKPIPVYGPSVLNTAAIGNISQYMDYGNIHDYSGGYNLTSPQIVPALATESLMSGSKPVVASENGYATGSTGQGMPNSVMLDYAQRLFFEQFANNVKRTMWYEFLDESNKVNDYWNNSGLVTATFQEKPAYVALKNVMALLKDQTPYTPRTPLNVSFGNQPLSEALNTLLLQKNDGSYWLAVWSDTSEWNPANTGVPGSYPVPAPSPYSNSMNFLGTYISSITQYQVDATGAMTSQPVAVANGSTAQISVSGRPEIFKIVPGVAPAAPGAPAVANPAAHWSLDEGSGTVAADSVDPAGNFTVPSNSLKIAWVSGKYNAALGFNGTQVSTTKTFIDTTQSYSATAWVQMTGLAGFQAAVTANGLVQAAFSLDYTPQSNLSYTTYPSDAAGGGTRIGSTTVPVIGQWYAVAATYNGTSHKMSFYLNGVLQGTATAAQVFNAVGGTEIGSMEAAGVGHYQWWNGAVDEVNLYQRELTPAEVATMAGL